MTKRNRLIIILDSVFVAAFNILFFMNAGSSHDTSIWICYGFLHFAYFMVLLTPVIEANGKNAYLARLTTYAISFLYFLTEFILTVFVVLYESQNGDSLGIKFVISIQTILTAIYLIVLLSNLLANNATSSKEAEHDAQNGFIKTMSSISNLLQNQV
ncbi:MAG: hypothetical protein J5710_04855 [Treponema sp.]|nr:hypothetical protein [Treponema sp.]